MKEESRYYVGTERNGLFDARTQPIEFFTDNDSRKRWVAVLIFFIITAIVSGVILSRRLREAYLSQTLYASPEEAVQAEIHKGLMTRRGISADINEIVYDPDETESALGEMRQSNAAAELGYEETELDGNFAVYRARWYAQYSANSGYARDGMTEQYFYLIRDPSSGQWICVKTAPVTSGG